MAAASALLTANQKVRQRFKKSFSSGGENLRQTTGSLAGDRYRQTSAPLQNRIAYWEQSGG